jgi:hypothetical protein
MLLCAEVEELFSPSPGQGGAALYRLYLKLMLLCAEVEEL